MTTESTALVPVTGITTVTEELDELHHALGAAIDPQDIIFMVIGDPKKDNVKIRAYIQQDAIINRLNAVLGVGRWGVVITPVTVQRTHVETVSPTVDGSAAAQRTVTKRVRRYTEKPDTPQAVQVEETTIDIQLAGEVRTVTESEIVTVAQATIYYNGQPYVGWGEFSTIGKSLTAGTMAFKAAAYRLGMNYTHRIDVPVDWLQRQGYTVNKLGNLPESIQGKIRQELQAHPTHFVKEYIVDQEELADVIDVTEVRRSEARRVVVPEGGVL